jgi:tRNA-splicing ligase RtcB
VELGWGHDEDLACIESEGQLEHEGNAVSSRAMQRGLKSLGTLGSGNHFLELQCVDKTVDEEAAAIYGLRPGQICLMIHSGSRGLGHQVCSEHVDVMERMYSPRGDEWYSEEWDWSLPDRQLAAAPIYSKQGQSYLEAMNAAGNFAFANRSALAQRARKVLNKHLGADGEAVLLYDVSHNIAKIENHNIDGRNCSCCVHRKGATRAFSGDSGDISLKFSEVGQPVLVPGDMGTASWILAGPKAGNNRAFGSSCHWAGRALSRTAARKLIDSDALAEDLEER